jgi:ferrous iron transport protein A
MGVAPGAIIILEQNSPSFIIKVENTSLALDIETIRAIYIRIINN